MIRKEPRPSLYRALLNFVDAHGLNRYRYLIPISLVMGAAFEYFRIFWTPLNVNFYDTFLRRYRGRYLDDFRQQLEWDNYYKLEEYKRQLEEEAIRKKSATK